MAVRRSALFLLLAAYFLNLGLWPAPSLSDDQVRRRQALFEEVFGEKVRLPSERIQQVRALPPGERLWIDSDGDGRVDEVWFIDTASRHLDSHRPVLVRAIDEDGDLRPGREPDLDSDLYVADWKADGAVDVVLDYTDLDGDGDIDEMAFFFYRPSDPYFGEGTLCAWWAKDLGDDNLLWHDVGFAYSQAHCQWRCHFGGDEIFSHFALRHNPLRWVPTWENPFIFYDHDGDGCSEEIVRISGRAERVENLRWSMDADNDSSPRNPHDYDFSLTSWAAGCRWQRPDRRPGLSNLRFGPRVAEKTTLRGIPTGPFLAPDSCRRWARRSPWVRSLLVWDEIDYNCQGAMAADPHERWEGVIAQGNDDFPQVGGPGCGRLNKRNELIFATDALPSLYWSQLDRRIHLFGAVRAWLDVDYDLDGKKDMAYSWSDTDRDGYFDLWRIDLDADGRTDLALSQPRARRFATPIALDHGELSRFYRARLEETLVANRRLIAALKKALLSRESDFRLDQVEQFYVQRLEKILTRAGVGAKIRRSRESARFYQELIRDRYLARLERLVAGQPVWKEIEKLRRRGDLEAMARLVESRLVAPLDPGRLARLRPRPLVPYSRRLDLVVSNPFDRPAENDPVEVALDAIRRLAGDFNPRGCAVAAPDRWIAPRLVASQVQPSADGSGGRLVFLADCPPRSSVAYSLYYHPDGAPPLHFPRRTATAEDWVPPNIGWESDRCAYRSYWGQFDFFGKTRPCLILPDIAGKDYHQELERGMDALNVIKTSGIGGLTLYVNGKPYLVQNPAGQGQVKFSKRVLAEGPVFAAVEIVASQVGEPSSPYTVRIRARAFAGRTESPIEVLVSGGRPDDALQLGIGFTRLAVEDIVLDTASGIFAAWGYQTAEIGRVGLGLVFDPARFVSVRELPDERRIVLAIKRDEPLTYWIIGDWLRGRRFDRCPTIDNWHRELRALALAFQRPLRVEIRKAEPAR